jgi:hypothetical protein
MEKIWHNTTARGVILSVLVDSPASLSFTIQERLGREYSAKDQCVKSTIQIITLQRCRDEDEVGWETSLGLVLADTVKNFGHLEHRSIAVGCQGGAQPGTANRGHGLVHGFPILMQLPHQCLEL